MIEKKIKDLQVKFMGELDWAKLRDFMVIKFQECKTEEEFSFIIEALIGSMFSNVKEMEEARKKLLLKHISDSEKRKVTKFFEENK
jgi:hypothetical protein